MWTISSASTASTDECDGSERETSHTSTQITEFQRAFDSYVATSTYLRFVDEQGHRSIAEHGDMENRRSILFSGASLWLDESRCREWRTIRWWRRWRGWRKCSSPSHSLHYSALSHTGSDSVQYLGKMGLSQFVLLLFHHIDHNRIWWFRARLGIKCFGREREVDIGCAIYPSWSRSDCHVCQLDERTTQPKSQTCR